MMPNVRALLRQLAQLASVRWSVRFKIIFAVALGAIVAGHSRTAFAASAACTATNAGAMNVTDVSGTGTYGPAVAGFLPGETLTLVISGPGAFQSRLVHAVTTALLLTDSPASPRSYTVTGVGDTNLMAGTQSILLGQSSTVTVTCTDGSSTPSSSSQIIDQMRQTFSKVAAQASSDAMGDTVNGALNDAFGDGGTTQVANGRISTTFAALENSKSRDDSRDAYAALGYGKERMITKAAPALPSSPWHAWIDARYTDFNDRSDSTNKFDGHNTNVTGGLSYRFNRDFVAGFVTGYEDFKYDVSSLNAFLKGDGWHAGGYFGWKFWDKLRLDGMLTYGQIDYGAQAGIVTGGWNADRVTGMLRLAGRYGFGTYYVEPSARVTWARESQDAFIDSAGVAHNDFGFTVGRAGVGAEVGTPLIWSNTVVTPYVGLFGDYRFGDETIAAASVVPNLENGWSARVTGGVSWLSSTGLTASIGGEYGGLGDTIQYWRGKASVGVKF